MNAIATQNAQTLLGVMGMSSAMIQVLIEAVVNLVKPDVKTRHRSVLKKTKSVMHHAMVMPAALNQMTTL